MSVLCDRIEEFILAALEESQGQAEVKRNELAVQFGCAPSQISYVLTTRFCPLRGYLVEGRRGGGGYTKIVRVKPDRAESIGHLVNGELSRPVSARRAEEIVRDLTSGGIIREDQANVMYAAVSPKALRGAGENADKVRSSVLGSMLLQCI